MLLMFLHIFFLILFFFTTTDNVAVEGNDKDVDDFAVIGKWGKIVYAAAATPIAVF